MLSWSCWTDVGSQYGWRDPRHLHHHHHSYLQKKHPHHHPGSEDQRPAVWDITWQLKEEKEEAEAGKGKDTLV